MNWTEVTMMDKQQLLAIESYAIYYCTKYLHKAMWIQKQY